MKKFLILLTVFVMLLAVGCAPIADDDTQSKDEGTKPSGTDATGGTESTTPKDPDEGIELPEVPILPGPDDGTDNTDATQPTDPDQPTTPDEPGDPENPTDPDTPSDSTEPSDPSDPSDPTDPEDEKDDPIELPDAHPK